MKTVGVICEFNPFHNGHKYLADKIKEAYPDCTLTAIMSGNFVQRGDVAVIDKFIRAKQALFNGFDLVIELPTVFAVSSAEIFAKSGVRIADALCCDILAFGTENNIEDLKKIAECVQGDDFKNLVKNELLSGKSYPQALNDTVLMLTNNSSKTEEILKGSNNILAIEYLKAIRNTSILPHAVKRKAVEHDSEITKDIFASASAIRELILNNNESWYKFIPENIDKKDFNNTAFIKNLELPLLYKLRTMTKEDFINLPDVSEGLENRIIEAVRNYNSISEITKHIKTKRYTEARIRRILVYALLSIDKDMQKTDVPYIRVLAFNKKGETVLSNARKKNLLPIISKVSQYKNILNFKEQKIFEKDLLASDIFALAQTNISICNKDFYSQIIKL